MCLSLGSFCSDGEQREVNAVATLELVFGCLVSIELFKGI